MQKFSVEIVRKKLVIEAANKEDAIDEAMKRVKINACLAKKFQCSFCKKQSDSKDGKSWHERHCKGNPQKQEEITSQIILKDLRDRLRKKFKGIKFSWSNTNGLSNCHPSCDPDPYEFHYFFFNISIKKMHGGSCEDVCLFYCNFYFDGKKFEVQPNKVEGGFRVKKGEQFYVCDPKYYEKIEEWVAEKKDRVEALYQKRKKREDNIKKMREKELEELEEEQQEMWRFKQAEAVVKFMAIDSEIGHSMLVDILEEETGYE